MRINSLKLVVPTKSVQKKHHHQTAFLYHCLYLLQSTEVRGFRILFGKPVRGQRTGSNAKTPQLQPHLLYHFKFMVLSNLFVATPTKPIFLAEYVNLFWQQQWVYEWVSSYRTVNNLPIYIRKTNFIDVASMVDYNIYHYYSNPFTSVKKKQRRKKVIPKNKFTTGLPFGFSATYSAQLKSINS